MVAFALLVPEVASIASMRSSHLACAVSVAMVLFDEGDGGVSTRRQREFLDKDLGG